MEATKQELLTENAELKRRLEEAEETLEALRSGAVDALVVSSPEGDQVFTLKGADQTYRHLIENINEGAATLTSEGDILYANGRLAEILRLPLKQVIGSALREYIAAADQDLADALFAQAGNGGSQGELLLRAGDGYAIPALLSLSSLQLEDVPGALSLVVTNLTQQKRQEAMLADGKLCQEILLQTVQAVAVCDRSGRITKASRGLPELCGQNPLLFPFHIVLPLKFPGNKTFLPVSLFQGETLHNVEANFQRPGGGQVHVIVNAGPLRDECGEITGFVAAFTDITERKQAESEKQNLLEKLRVSQEELQVLNEELRVINEELQAQTEELQAQTEELQTSNRKILTMHNAIRESREDLNRAQAVAHTGSWRLNVRQNKLIFSEENHRIFGIPPETPMSYETFLARVYPEDREYVDRKWTAALAGEPYDIEHRIVVGDTVKWVRSQSVLEFDAQGRLLGGFGTTQDINERKRTETALRESEERLRMAAQAGRMFAFEWDVRTDTAIRSSEADLILGLSSDAAVYGTGQGFFAKIQAEDRDNFIQMLQKLNPESDRYTANFRVVRPDNGQLIWMEEIAQAFFDAHGKLQRIYGICMDITERKQAEAALRAAHIQAINEKNRLEAVMAALPVGVSIIDERGGTVQCNDKFDKLWGSPRPVAQEVSDYSAYKAWWLDTGKQLQPDEWASAQAVQQGKTVVGQLLEIERFDGVRRYVINSGAPIRDADGRITGSVVAIFDITEQQQAEAALRKSEERLRLAQRAAQVGVWEWLPQKETLDCTPELEWLYGLHSGTLRTYQDWRKLVHTEDLPHIEAKLNDTFFHKIPFDLEFRIRHASGETRWLQAKGGASFSEDGQPERVFGISIEITERKQMEEALHLAHDEMEKRVRERTKDLQFTVTQLQEEVRERLRAEAELSRQSKLVHDLYNQAPCGYHSLDSEGKFVQINDTELAWLGYCREEVVGRMNFSDFLTADSQKSFRQTFPGFLERGSMHDLEYQMVRKDGTVFPVLLSATVVTDETGNYLMSRGTVYDLTARVQAEAALTRERQRLFQVLEHLPAYVALLAPDYTVSYANREFIRRFGVAEEGQRCYEYLFGWDKPCERCLTFTVLETKASQEWEWLGPDGRTYGVFDYPFTDVDGSPLILELGLDITARKRAEQALRDSEERLRFLANQLISAQENERKRLAGELHDELGHALLTLRLSLGSIARKLLPEQENVKELLQEQLDYISHVIEEVRRLYNDLSPGDLEDLGLTKALENLIEDFGGHQHDVSWQVDLPELQGRFSLTVQIIIYRLVQEALTNIGKHAEPTQVSISAREENGCVCLVIEDDGHGFDLSEIDGDPNRGIGLAAMRERLYFLGGSLEIWSQKGQGTRLTFTIPTLPKGPLPSG